MAKLTSEFRRNVHLFAVTCDICFQFVWVGVELQGPQAITCVLRESQPLTIPLPGPLSHVNGVPRARATVQKGMASVPSLKESKGDSNS